MDVLLVTWGTDGDTRPMLALAQGLMARGHGVVVLADRSGAALAEEVGVPFEAVGGDFRLLMQGDNAVGRSMSRGSSPVTTWRSLGRDFAGPLVDQIRRHALVDVIVGGSMGRIPAELVARRLPGVQMVGVDLQPFTATKEFPPPLMGINRLPPIMNKPLYVGMHAAMNAVGRVYLSPRIPKPWVDNDVPPVSLAAWSSSLVPRPSDWPRGGPEIVGDFQFRTPYLEPDDRLSAFLEAGDPPIFLGLGSMTGMDLGPLLTAFVDALQGRRAIVAAGWSGLGGDHLPTSIFTVGQYPFEWLFPRCSVVIHHAGAGTTHTVARSGTPSVGIPQVADQGFWAHRLHQLGVAAPPIDRHHITPDRIRTALDQAATLEENAKHLAAQMAGEDGTATAVQRIEAAMPNHSG